ncbi:MAG: nucleoside triphosphate pyrophosphatase [Myxococcales bacterium]|nr:nucleoside triphosphate pyrophosphatase [Myxococcales bacterium]
MTPWILASTSPYRRSLLDRMGIPYEVIAPSFEEVEPSGGDPVSCARLFAEGKARLVAGTRPEALVIGADQTLEFEGRMLRKPGTLEEAAEQLFGLAGRWHRLHSAVAVVEPGGTLREGVATVELKMRKLSSEEVRRYVEQDQPYGSVGGYVYERRGFLLFDEVRGSDDSAIIGLPLWLLGRLLREARAL